MLASHAGVFFSRLAQQNTTSYSSLRGTKSHPTLPYYCLILSAGFLKVARYSFSGPIPSKFERKLRRHKQSFEKIAATVVLDEDGNLL